MLSSLFSYKPSKNTLYQAALAVVLFIPINLIVWHLSNKNGLERSYFNVDYLLVLVFSAFFYKLSVSRIIFLTSFVVVYIIDIAKLIMEKFNFEENIFDIAADFGGFAQSKIIYDLYFASVGSELRQIGLEPIIIAIVLFIVSLFVFFRFKKIWKIIFTIIALIILVLLLAFKNDSVFLISFILLIFIILFFVCFWKVIGSLLSKPDLLVVAIAFSYFFLLWGKTNRPQDYQRNFFSNFNTLVVFSFKVEEENISSATSILFDKIGSSEISAYDNIILIIVESLGVLKDESAMKDILSVFDDKKLKANYNVEISYLNYKGHTTTAEFRELCGIQVMGLPNLTNKGQFEDCLPSKLSEKGYNVTAIHNSVKYVFDRNEWWPLLNFNKMLFLHDMKHEYGFKKNELCNGGAGYHAICEKDVIQKVFPKILGSNSKNFLYFLTVESHVPVDERVTVSKDFEKICKENEVLSNSKQICKIYDIQNNLFVNLINLANSITDKRNIIIIVGDHTPPYFKKELSIEFNQELVPMVIINSNNN